MRCIVFVRQTTPARRRGAVALYWCTLFHPSHALPDFLRATRCPGRPSTARGSLLLSHVPAAAPQGQLFQWNEPLNLRARRPIGKLRHHHQRVFPFIAPKPFARLQNRRDRRDLRPRSFAADLHPVFAPKRNRTHRILRQIVVDLHLPVLATGGALQPLPLFGQTEPGTRCWNGGGRGVCGFPTRCGGGGCLTRNAACREDCRTGTPARRGSSLGGCAMKVESPQPSKAILTQVRPALPRARARKLEQKQFLNLRLSSS